ncbi:BnaC04g03490D [Brassica napus]|uniref:BnaC04g03490D protein n=1 Tax=Brassica napus TaxID=3708 RepID=A0A078FTL0_BRANA|nr:BnaC04g03490D [Brassica napus]
MGPAPEHLMNLTVKDLILPNGSDWNRALIKQILPHEEATILSIKPRKSGAPDKMVWLGTSSGVYTTKSGYLKAMEDGNVQTQTPTAIGIDWNNNVWKLQVPPKIKLFLWKIFQGALPVGDRLASRNILVDTVCKSYSNVESINHLFLHCDVAYKVWNLAPFSTCIDSRGLIDLTTAWKGLYKLVCLPPSGIASGPLAPWILWSLWLARNNRIFNNKESTPEKIITKAVTAAQEWLREQTPEPSDSDAAWRSDSQRAGLGWTVIENELNSDYMAHCLYVPSPLVAEALALREAMAHCRAQGILQLHCQMDSQQLVKTLISKSPNPEIYGVVSDILLLASSFLSISYEWFPRSKNKVADALAKQALYNVCLVSPNLDNGV